MLVGVQYACRARSDLQRDDVLPYATTSLARRTPENIHRVRVGKKFR